MASGTATTRHAQPPHITTTQSLTSRLATFMGFQPRHHHHHHPSPRTPPDHGMDHDPWIALPQPQASTSSFGAGTLRSLHTVDGGPYGVSAFSSEEGGASSYHHQHQQHLQAPAVGAGLSPYLAAPNAFAKQQQQPQIFTATAPPPPRSTSPWGGSGSSFSSPIEPAPGRGGFLQSLGRSASTRETSHHHHHHHHNQPTSLSASAPAPSTSKVSPLKQRLRTSGLFPTSSSSISPSKQTSGGSTSKKLHYMQASLAAFDGGIGESPVPSRKGKEKASYVVGGTGAGGSGGSVVVKEKEKEKEREKIRKKEKESGMKFPSYYSATPPPATAPPHYPRDKRHSPLSPLIGFASSSHHHQSPTIGKALGVRTSLLGFGTESPLGMWDTSSPVGAGRGAAGDAADMFDKPRKAPLPPGHTPSPSNTSTSAIAEEDKVESHSRKPSVEMGGMYAPGGPSTLGPVREESEGQMGTSQEGSGEGDGRQGERDEDRLSPAPQRQYVVVTPPPPQDDGLQEAITIPLPPSASSHHTESSRQPSPTSTFPSPISPLSPNQIPPPLHSKGRSHQRTRTPNEGSGSTSQKPPIPPKSQETMRMAQGGAKILKGYSSTPNLLVAAFGSAGAAGGSVNVSPSKGKGKERVHVDEALNTQRSPSSAAAAPAAPTGSRLAAQLQAQTICDALMFPKPRFVAHVISPPGTPEAFSAPSRPLHADPSSSTTPRSPYVLPEIIPPPPLSLDKVLKEGEMRERERDQWAAKASRGLLSRNASTRSRAHTDASGGSLRGRNLSVTSASTGSGLVNRLRARTLSGRKGHGKGHKRGDSKETQQTSEMGEIEGGGGARIGGRTGTLRGLKKEPSYEFDTIRQRQVAVAQARDSPTPATMTTSATKPVPLGKQGKLSISLNEKDLHQATVTVRAQTDSGGTVRSTHTTSGTTHSRKSSGQSRHIPFSSHPFASHSRSGSSGSVSAGAASAASYAIRKVKSLCGPERLSPAAEEIGFVGGRREEEKKSQVDPAAARPSVERRATVPRESLYEDRMMEALSDRPLPIVVPQRQGPVLDVEEEEEEDYGSGERHLVDPSYEVGVALGGEPSAPASRRESAMAAGSHGTSPRTMRESLSAPSPSQPDTSSSHLDMDDGEDDETAQIHQVTRRVSMTPAQSRQSISAVGGPSPIDIPNMRPVPTPSPSPSSYHGVYGIAIGTPNFNHPFVVSSQDRISDIPNLPAGPHPTSPTYLQLPVSNDLVSRHRLPPHRAPLHPPPNIALPTPPVSSEHHGSNRNTADISDVPSEYDDEPSSLMPMYAPSSVATASPRRNAHPYAVHSPAPSVPRNYRMSVNSVEAMFGGELLESSHTVSPLGVREAGESWINSTDADLKGLSTPAEEDEYRHSGDSGLGSSTEIHSLQRSTQSRHRSKPSRAATQSSSIGSMLIESPPPSMFPSFRQNRDSSMFDTMTFGPGDDFSIYEGDRSRPLSEIAPEPAPATKPNAPESISSSSTSSVELQQRPLGSSDDLESFKDLFYVPRSRQPSASSPKFRRSEASGDSKIADPDLHEIEAYARSLPSSDARSRSSSARILSPLSSVLEMRQSFAPDLDSPYRAHALEDPNETVHYNGYFPPRASVYDIMEEDESVHSVSSVERNTEEDVRFGTVNASAPYVTAGRLNRQSTQPSLFDDDSESPLPAVPRARPSFLDTESSNPAYRASYMTTTSGTSLGNRMSHIISDFPTPPINNPSSSGFLDFYTGSQGASPDTHSFSSIPQPLVPRPPIPFRSDSFGPQT